jgi:hypothetical protein
MTPFAQPRPFHGQALALLAFEFIYVLWWTLTTKP